MTHPNNSEARAAWAAYYGGTHGAWEALSPEQRAQWEAVSAGVLAAQGAAEVTGCDGCPLEYDTIACKHPGWDHDKSDLGEHEDVYMRTPHQHCPLRKGPVTLRLKEGV